jgi:phenylacetate-CoA ligase
MKIDQQSPYSLDRAVKLRREDSNIIEREQLFAIKKHLQQASCITFYRELFDREGIDVDSLSDLSDFSQLPFTTRQDIDQAPSKFGLDDSTRFRDIALTSGTTGEPVVVPYTAADLQRLAFNEAVAFHGVGVQEKDAVLLTVTLDRCFIAGLAYYSGAALLGASVIRSGPGQPARQWHIIEKLQPGIIVGVPTFLKELAVWGLENGLKVAEFPIHSLVTIGESTRKHDLSPTSLGRELEELWGAKTFSSYGATEFETAFCECSASAGGHIHPELMLVEIVDDGGNILPDGEAGEIVVTPLGVEGFPLVRFKTGDVGRQYSSPCSCGWNTKRLGPVEGRLVQRLKYKGTTLYPETIFHVLHDIVAVTDAYVEVRSTAAGADDITVVVGGDFNGQDVSMIEDQLQAHLRVRPTVQCRKSEDVCAVMTEAGGRKPKRFFDYRLK